MTKNNVRADLQIAINLAKLTQAYCDKLCDELAASSDDDFFDIIDEIQSYERTDVDEIMKELEEKNYFKDAHITEEGSSDMHIPEISIDDNMCITIRVPVNGGYLVAANGKSDYSTEQACVLYEHNDYQIDLAFAEVKSGALATVNGLSPDNKDVDLYIFADPYTEDFTKKEIISHEDIMKAMSDKT